MKSINSFVMVPLKPIIKPTADSVPIEKYHTLNINQKLIRTHFIISEKFLY